MKFDGQYQLLSTYVYDAIKKSILYGELAADEKVTESSIAKTLGVSRTPVREALRSLCSEGYVKLTPNASFVVNKFTKKDAIEALEIRRQIEGFAARQAAERVASKQVKTSAIEQRIRLERSGEKRLYNTSEEKRFFAFTELDIAFHAFIAGICGNSKIDLVERMIQDRMARACVSQNSDNTMIEACANQHDAILHAILEGDGDAAEVCSDAHIYFVIQLVMSLPD